VKSIMELHGGTVTVRRAAPRHTITLRSPCQGRQKMTHLSSCGHVLSPSWLCLLSETRAPRVSTTSAPASRHQSWGILSGVLLHAWRVFHPHTRFPIAA